MKHRRMPACEHVLSPEAKGEREFTVFNLQTPQQVMFKSGIMMPVGSLILCEDCLASFKTDMSLPIVFGMMNIYDDEEEDVDDANLPRTRENL